MRDPQEAASRLRANEVQAILRFARSGRPRNWTSRYHEHLSSLGIVDVVSPDPLGRDDYRLVTLTPFGHKVAEELNQD